MQTKVQTHKKKMQGNTPVALPLIIRPNIVEQLTEQLTKPLVLSTKCPRIMASHTKQAKAGNVVTPSDPCICTASNHQPMSDSATQE
jgi:hypothetical protein